MQSCRYIIADVIMSEYVTRDRPIGRINFGR
jgi:hypothetical protein